MLLPGQTESTVGQLRERNAQLETVFDQSNAAISQLQGEHTAAKKVQCRCYVPCPPRSLPPSACAEALPLVAGRMPWVRGAKPAVLFVPVGSLRLKPNGSIKAVERAGRYGISPVLHLLSNRGSPTNYAASWQG